MKNLIIILFALCIASCSTTTSDTSNKDITEDTTSSIEPKVKEETIIIDEIETLPTVKEYIANYKDSNFVFIQMIPDGPDDDWYPKYLQGKELLLDSTIRITIHLLPYQNTNGYSFLTSELGFYYKELENFHGEVVLYYDTLAQHKAGSALFENGKVYGDVIVRDFDDNEILSHRVYEYGEWVESIIAPACANWVFDKANSSLTITDVTNSHELGETESFDLIPSVHDDSKYGWLSEIIEKETFSMPFTVNGEEYTGALYGYETPSGPDLEMYFELNFVNGLLDGTVKIYDTYYGGLILEEIFDKGELVETVFTQPEMDGVAKPIIYIYPEEETEVNVSLNFNGKLTHTYPKYPKNGWNVKAMPNGTLYDSVGKEYYALFWEGNNSKPFNITEGSVVKGSETVAFLEGVLPQLGLNAREMNEFIIYWMPLMENNPYNLIHFSTTQYEEMAELIIDPKPETIIRVMMVWKPLSEEIDIKNQDIQSLAKTRKGYTVVEWGGKKLSNSLLQKL
jgi:hypothetical protein